MASGFLTPKQSITLRGPPSSFPGFKAIPGLLGPPCIKHLGLVGPAPSELPRSSEGASASAWLDSRVSEQVNREECAAAARGAGVFLA